MRWERREALFFQGAPLALIPAISFLPAFAYLVLTPRFTHAPLVTLGLFPILCAAEIWGILKLVRCIQHDFDLLTILAFGTDYPVEPIAPFRGLYASVTRKNEAGTAEFFPEQKLTIDEAIAAYTTGAAYAEFAEHDKGLIAPGMLADFVVLDRDLTKVPPAEILHTRVLRTVVAGKTVYEAK